MYNRQMLARHRAQRYSIDVFSDAIFKRIESDTQFLSQMRIASSGGDTNDTHSLSTDDNTRRHMLQWLNKYYSRMEHLCLAYLMPLAQKLAVDPFHTDINASVWKQRTVYLQMPLTWPQSCFQELAEEITDFLVSGIEYEFLVLGLGATDPVTLQRQQALLEAGDSITASLNMRCPAPQPVGFPGYL